ncbi:MAG: ABC transporter transmembrane domain-containing protein [Bdellovibrionota bacterium]
MKTHQQRTRAYLDQETSFRGQYSKEVFQTLYFAYRPVALRMSFLVVLGFIGRVSLLSNANLIGIWVDSFCRAPSVCRPVPEFFHGFANEDYVSLLVLVTAVGFALTVIYRIGFSRSSAAAVSRFYDEVTLRTSRFPIQFFDQNPVGRVVTRFSSDYGNVFRLFGGPLAEFIGIVFDLVAMFALVIVASPYYLPVFIGIALLNALVYRLNLGRLRHERRELSASRSPSIAHFAETSQGASTIRVFARQGVFLRRFLELNDAYVGQRRKTGKVLSLFSLQMSFMTALLLFVTGVAGLGLSNAGLVSIGSIGVAFTFIALSGSSLQMFFDWLAQFEEAMTGVERLDDYLRRPLEPGLKLPAARRFPTSHPVYAVNEEAEIQKSRLVKAPSAAVQVEDLWLRYGADRPFVLKGIDVSIRPGEKIGIVGRTGSGKTSFVQALFQLYPFEKGRILIDGREAATSQVDVATGPSRVDLSVFRRSIALISQEPTLFRGALRENLDLVGERDDAELTAALERVGLGSWLAAQPLGLEAVIEERGRNLSAGERQLLCMARCLLQDAPVVVMDEATSSVDPQSEEILVRATREFFADRTQIIIAHRLSTLEHCDRILWLHEGQVKLFDRPETVLPVFREATL